MIYGYKCKCGSEVERNFKMGDATMKMKCKKCNNYMFRDYSISVSVPDPVSDAREGRGKG